MAMRDHGELAMRVADVQLRGTGGRLPARVYWPAPTDVPVPLLVAFAGSDVLAREMCRQAGVIAMSATCRSATVDDAAAALCWSADHAAELDADPRVLFVAGEGPGCHLAAAVVRRAHYNRWPPIVRQLLVCTPDDAAPACDSSVAGVAPATVVTIGPDAADYGARSYAVRLRQAGVDVEELHYESPANAADRMLAELARAMRRELPRPGTDDF